MNNYQFPYPSSQPGQTYNQIQQIQQMFPQPQGSVYSINSLAEIGNVPIGSTGLSIALCLSESIMYIKSFQNGNPVIMAYRIAPYTKEEADQSAAEGNSYEERLLKLEEAVKAITNNNGGKFNGLL